MPNKEAVLAEISRDAPTKHRGRPGFVMNAYGCSVFEEHDEYMGRFSYTAVNDATGKSETVARGRRPLSTDGDELCKFALKVRDSRVGGPGRIEAAEGTPLAKLKEITRELFRVILPKYGRYKIREEQIALAEELLDAIVGRRTLLAEAPTGIGKTLVYIIVGTLVRRSQINKTWNNGYFPEVSVVDWLRMGIVVSTSSIALQKAILTEVIPGISGIMTDWGIIREPISAVLRKGKEHYVCEDRLAKRIHYERDGGTKDALCRLAADWRVIDLAEAEGLAADVKSKIGVPGRCIDNCRHKECRYKSFIDGTKRTVYDFTICNHQLLLADARLRADGLGAVLPYYQTLILDEAHKLPPAAQMLYGTELAADEAPTVAGILAKLNFAPLAATKTDGWLTTRDSVVRLSEKLRNNNKRLFAQGDAGEGCDRPLRNIRDIADLTHRLLSESHEFKVGSDERIKRELVFELGRIRGAADALYDGDAAIRWFEEDEDEERTGMRGIPKNIGERLYEDLWRRGIPTMLTSGTLAVRDGDFSALKHSLGLDHKDARISEATHKSPFDYKDNCLLYLSGNVPDYREEGYIDALTDEIGRLVSASNGHAAILFTSYKTMRSAHARLKRRMPGIKDFMLERSTSAAIERYKASGNGVLFACGSMWEGIDCPGDILSLLVMAKLPFAQPDAINEYERTNHPDFATFFNSVLLPDMLLKIKQGFGRGFRTEGDTCAVAILDCRAGTVYREPLLATLPECRVTREIGDVGRFLREKKSPDYWE